VIKLHSSTNNSLHYSTTVALKEPPTIHLKLFDPINIIVDADPQVYVTLTNPSSGVVLAAKTPVWLPNRQSASAGIWVIEIKATWGRWIAGTEKSKITIRAGRATCVTANELQQTVTCPYETPLLMHDRPNTLTALALSSMALISTGDVLEIGTMITKEVAEDIHKALSNLFFRFFGGFKKLEEESGLEGWNSAWKQLKKYEGPAFFKLIRIGWVSSALACPPCDQHGFPLPLCKELLPKARFDSNPWPDCNDGHIWLLDFFVFLSPWLVHPFDFPLGWGMLLSLLALRWQKSPGWLSFFTGLIGAIFWSCVIIPASFFLIEWEVELCREYGIGFDCSSPPTYVDMWIRIVALSAPYIIDIGAMLQGQNAQQHIERVPNVQQHVKQVEREETSSDEESDSDGESDSLQGGKCIEQSDPPRCQSPPLPHSLSSDVSHYSGPAAQSPKNSALKRQISPLELPNVEKSNITCTSEEKRDITCTNNGANTQTEQITSCPLNTNSTISPDPDVSQSRQRPEKRKGSTDVDEMNKPKKERRIDDAMVP